jgi:hypothetical protein
MAWGIFFRFTKERAYRGEILVTRDEPVGNDLLEGTQAS